MTDGTLHEDPGRIGEIHIRGTNVISSYESDTGYPSDSFSNGWFNTGDTGYLSKDGFLYLVGRTKAQINKGGEKVSPDEVVAAALTCEGVVDACVLTLNHPTLGQDIGLAVQMADDVVFDDVIMRRSMSQRLAIYKVPSIIKAVSFIPRSSYGKLLRVDYDALMQQFRQDGSTASDTIELAEMDGEILEDVIRHLTMVWSQEIGQSNIDIDANFAQLGGDSLAGMRIVAAAEELFGIEYKDEDIVSFTTVRHMATCTYELLRQASPKLKKESGSGTDWSSAINPSDMVSIGLLPKQPAQLSGDLSWIIQQLKSIWQRELGHDTVGEDTSFTELGGDSLSSMRIVVAAEEEFGIEYSDEEIISLISVRRMAEATATKLLRTTDADYASISGALISERSTMLGHAKDWEASPDTSLSRFLKLIYSARTPTQLSVFLEEACNIATYDELLYLTSAAVLGFSTNSPLEPTPQKGCLEIVRQFRDKVISERGSGYTCWQRRKILPTVHYYTRADSESPTSADIRSKILVVGFAGRMDRLMMPMDLFLSHINPVDYNLLFISDPTKLRYEEGIEGCGSNPASMAHELQSIITGIGCERVIGLGTSMGAIPAMCCGFLLGWEKVYLMAPSTPENHPKASQSIEEKSTAVPISMNPSTTIYVAENNKNDQANARLVRRLAPVDIKFLRDCESHNVLWDLHGLGRLKAFMKHLFPPGQSLKQSNDHPWGQSL